MIADLLDGQRQVDETESCLKAVEKHRHRLVTLGVYTETTSICHIASRLTIHAGVENEKGEKMKDYRKRGGTYYKKQL